MDVNSTAATPDDRQLILQARDGDKNAYGQLILRYQKRLFRFLIMMLGRKDSAEDIMQDAFVNGYLALQTFDPDKEFYPWLATIARNLALNALKRASRVGTEAELETAIKTIPDKSDTPVENLIAAENDRRLAAAVAALPEQFRIVFVMKMIENMSYEEIATRLNISRATVDTRLFRARQRLVELLKDSL